MNGLLRRTGDALLQPRSTTALLVLSSVASVTYGIWLLSWPVIAGDGAFWIFPRGTYTPGHSLNVDMADGFIGYLRFLSTPWRWDLTHVEEVLPPAGVKAAWMDMIPIVGLVAKLWRSISGSQVNLMGWYLLACFALPGVAMTGILLMSGQRDFRAMILGTTIGLTSPWLLFRWGHPSLLAQVVIIAALLLYLYRPNAPLRIAVLWACVLLSALLTSVYFVPMVGLFLLASLLRNCMEGQMRWWTALLHMAGILTPTLVMLLLLGLVGPDVPSPKGEGYGQYSFDLLSPLLPQMSGLVPGLSGFFLNRADGFAWLGMGGVLLVGASLTLSPSVWATALRRNWVLALLLLLCALFAVSNRVAFGSRILFVIPLPEAVLDVAAIFRASGRMIWPCLYTLLAFAAIVFLRSTSGRRSAAVVLALVFFQIVDTAPLRQQIRNSIDVPFLPRFSPAKVGALILASTSVEAYPSYECGEGAWPLREQMMEANVEIQLLAARANRPINSAYLARPIGRCAAEVAAAAIQPKPGTLRIDLRPTAAMEQEVTPIMSGVCEIISGARFCLIPTRVDP